MWTNIKPLLEEFLENQKAERVEREHEAAVRERIRIFNAIVNEYQHACRPHIIPPIADIYESMDGVEAIIHADSEIATLEMFADMKSELPRFAEDWCKSRSIELLDLLPPIEDDSTVEDGLSRLNLATTFFRCRNCSAAVAYPRILAHSCMVRLPARSNQIEERHELLQSRPWTFGLRRIGFDTKGHKAACHILEQCGRDPDTTLLADMDDIWVECVKCQTDSRRVVMPFASAV